MIDETQDTIAGVPLLPKQAEFVYDDTHARLMYSGAYGAGKTRSLCWRALRKAANPKAVVGLGRRTFADLRRTTLTTLFEGVGDLPPVLTPGTYHHVKKPGDEKIILHGGGRIIPFAFDRVLALGSLQFSDVMIDEAVEIEEKHWTQLIGRTRIVWRGREDVPSLSCATNPDGPMHFLFKQFFEGGEVGYHKVIETTTYDNFYLSPHFLRALGHMRGTARLRYLFGRWVSAEGLVFPMFERTIHERHHSGPFREYVAGVDEGYTNPKVLRIHGIYSDGCSHVVASFVAAEMTTEEFLPYCEQAQETYPRLLFIVDPSAASLIASMKKKNLRVRAGNNDLLPGINVVRSRLMPSPNDGQPRFTMEPDLPGNVMYLSYELDTGKQGEVPKKENDHVPDADRYALMEIERRYGGKRLIVAGKDRNRTSPPTGPAIHPLVKGFRAVDSAIPKNDPDWVQNDRLFRGAS